MAGIFEQKKGFRWLFACLLLALACTHLKAQDDGELDEDQPNRLFVEKDWVRWTGSNPTPEKIEKLVVEEAENFSPELLKNFPALRGLIIKDTPLQNLHFMRYLPVLRVLEIQGNYLKTLDGIEGSIQLEELFVSNNFLTSVKQLSGLVNLKRLRLYDNDITDIAPIAKLTSITSLDLAKNKITSIAPLKGFTQLRFFSVYSCTSLTDISIIRNFTNLNDLNISLLNIPGFSLSVLSGMTKMKNLRIQGMVRNDAELNYIKNMTELEQLTMGLNDGVTRLDSLWRLTALKYLDIHSNNVTSIGVLENFHSLVKVVMYSNKVEDISPLKGCPLIRSLFLYNNPVKDYSVLYQFRELQYLHLSAKDFDALKQQQMKSKLPGTRILFY